MLRNCTKTEFDLYADFAYELATNIEKSAYPTYCDGLKTKEMFMERLSKAFERDTEEVLLFEIDGKIEGLIHYQWLPKCHASNYSSHLLQLYCKINPTSPSYHLS